MQYINIVTLTFTLLAHYKYICYIINVRQNDYPLPPKTMEHKHEIFIPHTKYYYSFVCDASSYVEIEVIKRTAKTVTIKDQFGEVSRKKIFVWNGVECIKPCGSYSMNPICTAEKIVKEERFFSCTKHIENFMKS